ncbi:MAG: SIS domain-containing protein [Desulfovibrio sp.]|jgi:D-sedoheptulose 7-phosphate isomerase|nr:SIS domain-containing protein [Desulfovibrio sp.]
MTDSPFQSNLTSHVALLNALPALEPDIAAVLGLLREALLRGNKILVAGNGGSAADAQHFTGELVGSFQRNRRALPCLALTVDTSNLTAIGNDFGFDEVFARQIEGLGNKGDVFLGLSTSGNSANIIKATEAAHVAGLAVAGLLGRDGGALKSLMRETVIVPHMVTARIQEAHIFILHYWAEMLERDCA